MTLTKDLKTLLITNSIILAAIIAIPALFFYPLKGSADVNVYTSPLKWLCLLGTVLFVTFGVQCAKSEDKAKKFLIPTAIGGSLFIAILAPSSGDSPVSSTVSIASIFSVFLLAISFPVEFIRYKMIGNSKEGTFASNILSLVIPAALITVAYFYNSDFLTKDFISTRWFAYGGLAAALYLNDSAFQYFRESAKEVQENIYSSSFILMNCLLWFFVSLLFILV